ncbi:hypothetical protein VT73_00565 [Rathayibacter toxicus]|uniref:Uncharacterized protein n=1 Tax=Rathayibacter toxicus TaxID=145458 RepID=A0A0C5BDC0_9MICO|nr:hypothetical protein TI83_01225 [Rathayibacter toxicus]KKM47228.1 hypothetical protein VT73_00565 [Rathayibacter toxicus]
MAALFAAWETLPEMAPVVMAPRSPVPAAAATRAPAAMSIPPIGPPTPVAMRAPPPMTMAAPARYSQLWASQSPAAANTPWFPSRYACSWVSVMGLSPVGSSAWTGSFPAKA